MRPVAFPPYQPINITPVTNDRLRLLTGGIRRYVEVILELLFARSARAAL
ncbi:MAG: hypothetical protein HPY76_13205 [Anaerolineae bacterium]|nr:hypothetical protein [Anaerolineae bacterium]